MADDEVDVGESDIQVAPPEEAAPSAVADASGAKGSAAKVTAMPARTYRKGKDWYGGLDKRDKMVVLVGFLVIVLFVVMLSIWITGSGGIGNGGDAVVKIPVSEWDRSGLETEVDSTSSDNTNLVGQNSPYLVRIQADASEVIFVTRLVGHVTWSDETSPPTSAPAIGYTNQPDGFKLRIIIQDGLGEWETELVFNTIGQQAEITIDIDLVEELGAPIAVASPQGAKYLPEPYYQMIRIDFIVSTEDCGPWTTDDPRPNIGDGGNHYTFEWSVEYQVDSTTRAP